MPEYTHEVDVDIFKECGRGSSITRRRHKSGSNVDHATPISGSCSCSLCNSVKRKPGPRKRGLDAEQLVAEASAAGALVAAEAAARAAYLAAQERGEGVCFYLSCHDAEP